MRANLTLYSTALYCQNGPHKIYQKYNMVKRIWFTIEKRIEKRVNGTVNHRLYNNIIIFSLYTLGNHANVCKINDGQPIWFTPMSTSNVHVTCIVIYFISECYHSTMAQRNDGRLPIHRPWVQYYVDTDIFFSNDISVPFASLCLFLYYYSMKEQLFTFFLTTTPTHRPIIITTLRN